MFTKEFITELAEKLSLDVNSVSEKKDILIFLQKFEVTQFILDKTQRDFLSDISNLLFKIFLNPIFGAGIHPFI